VRGGPLRKRFGGHNISNGTLNGVSTHCKPGATIEELAAGIRYNQIGVSTVGDIKAAGGKVTLDPNVRNPAHAIVDGLTPAQLEQLFTPVMPNPVPPSARQ
jgi:hypothetical protein